jgi:hypothetical protein
MFARTASALTVFAVVVTMSSTTSAFCRKTTCKPTEDACTKNEGGCITNGAPIRFRQLPIEFRFSAERPGQLVREEARAAIRAAFHRWSDTLCGADQRRTSLRFVEGEDILEDKPLAPGVKGAAAFGIYFRDRGWPYEGKEDATLAQTNTMYGKKSGFVEYADIEINTGARRFSTKEEETGVDLQAVMTHEVGHYIGLDHSLVPDSIMVSSYCEREGRCDKGKVAARRLAQDDIDAVCALYPPDGIGAAPASAQDSGCSNSPQHPTPPAFPLSFLLAPLFALFRRKLSR